MWNVAFQVFLVFWFSRFLVFQVSSFQNLGFQRPVSKFRNFRAARVLFYTARTLQFSEISDSLKGRFVQSGFRYWVWNRMDGVEIRSLREYVRCSA